MSQAAYSVNAGDFINADSNEILSSLKSFVPDVGDSQIVAWKNSIKILKEASKELPSDGAIILEYTIPLESRRIDAVLLLNGVVIVIEFKGKHIPIQADIDQAAAYARDLRAYHRSCESVPVKCLLVLAGSKGYECVDSIISIVDGTKLSHYCNKEIINDNEKIDTDAFLSINAYQPLPSLIKAARELFTTGNLTRIHRAAAATEPTLDICSEIIHNTASKDRRALILISGVPGAGKTLVGLQLAHAKYLDDLSVERSDGQKSTATAVFLSGNGPLVEVLQYELRSAGGDGKAFVRGVHEYVKTFTKKSQPIPPQHVLIYDEAQRAFDAAQVEAKHKNLPEESIGLSEPDLFIQFAERVPKWCVVVGLIGTGQEIHIGEEAGIVQWKHAIQKSQYADEWDVYRPEEKELHDSFSDLTHIQSYKELSLTQTIRFHLATQLYDFVEALLDGDVNTANSISVELANNGYNLKLTHNLYVAKDYLTNRYYGDTNARYGMIASSRDKDLKNHGVPKGFKSPGEAGPGKYGKWYAEPRNSEGSCANLDIVVTEFGAQGLELDSCLLAWGTDFVREDNSWSNKHASNYRDKHRIVDALLLRMNAYRVLLTRGRDGCVIFIPPIPDKMRDTYSFLKQCGFEELE